ncbi:NAD-dependent malic enzyme, partial [Photobacterium damselae]
IYLRNIQDTNETLFYRLVQNHISEMMPIIYTPTVGAACENFSNIYRRGRGLFISYPNRDRIEEMLNNASRQNVKVIVVTDGERILGLGDQGIGGMGIPIGKLSLYTACGGISPAYTLPVVLDVGTNNPQRLSDPMYMGWRHTRVTGPEYEKFVDEFIQAVKLRWPDALIQFEDFAQKNAMPLLERYKDKVCCFNDDIQGTAAVTVGSLLAACKAAGSKLSEQRVTFLGAGSAGCGIAEAIIAQMVSEKPTVLIGVSGVPGLFSEEVIKEMHAHCPRPIIFPLSNPTSRVEATPFDLIRWTDGNALVATGSPFEPVVYNGKTYPIAQCNNSYIFPGIGLGVLAVNARRVTDQMLQESSRALAECSPLAIHGHGALLPPLEEIQNVSRKIAFAVAKKAVEQHKAPKKSDERIR